MCHRVALSVGNLPSGAIGQASAKSGQLPSLSGSPKQPLRARRAGGGAAHQALPSRGTLWQGGWRESSNGLGLSIDNGTLSGNLATRF